MSSFNNNQILHIAAECAVIAAITFYISIKYKQIQANFESLNNRIEEQAEIIQKHEVIIKQLSLTLNKIINNSGSVSAKKFVNRDVNIMKGETSFETKSKVRREPQSYAKSPPKTELPVRKKPIIEEISVEEELKKELEELNFKTEKGDEKGDENSDLKNKKEEEKRDEK
jgi:hypothetical protein